MATLPNPQANATLLKTPRSALINHKLNLRNGPSVTAQRIGRLEPGQLMMVDRVIDAEPYLGRSAWLGVVGQEQYFWAGAAQLDDGMPAAGTSAAIATASASATATAIINGNVHRRASGGTILPLSQLELGTAFDTFAYQAGKQRGAIVITDNWVSNNIVTMTHPLLSGAGKDSMTVHSKAQAQFSAVFDAIVAANLADLILTFDGSFVPRHKNWDPDNPDLSSHSWGVAIDLNARWNSAGSSPALPGQLGDLGPLVPIFAAHGFAWGGHFSHNVDGMHFELALIDPTAS